MSTEKRKAPKRSYRKRRRAELEDETRGRITEATVELHGSLGPARTTVSAVADRAGVQRATVYRHFPDEQALFDACSSHWRAANPMPDVARWREIAAAEERLRTALEELYSWFDRTEYMIEKTTRDLAIVPALQPSMSAFAGWFETAADVLLRGRPQRGRPRRVVRAAIAHALAFTTWRSLVRGQELGQDTAVDLMVRLVSTAG